MFDEMPDHFLAAATSRTTNTSCSSTASLPLSFSLNQHANFDASFLLHHPHSPFQLQHQVTRTENKEPSVANSVLPASLSLPGCALPWSNEEVLSLLKIVSSMDNPWFPPEFTWENVSRKLAEIGFKRSADKCKEKFEDETRSFSTCSNNGNNNSIKHNIISQNYRLFGELEDLYNNNNTTTITNGDYGNDGEYPSNKLDDQLPDIEDCNKDEDGVQEEVGRIGGEKSGNDETGARGNIDNNMEEEEDEEEDDDDQVSGDDSEKTEENTKKVERKRKREKKFEMFKGFCEKIVNKMIAQQEELHCKILQDMVKRDEEKIAREEAWKKQEIDRIAHELEIRAHEQAIVGDRQAKILGFLNKFSSSSNFESESLRETLGNNVMMIKVPNNNVSLSTSSSILSQDSISATTTTAYDQKSMSNLVSQQKCNLPMSLSKENLAPQSHNKLAMPISSSTLDQASKSPNVMTSISPHKSFGSDHTNTDAAGQVMDFKSPEYEDDLKSRVVGDVKDDTGRRWPRDEVLALINIRCTLFNNTNGTDQHERESFSKGPLWERISHKMIELGYKRSAKRCKEKWENINKYFRKTKDSNKKRSVDSRTCPYFHQLSHLYNQGTSLGQPDRSVTVVGSPGDQSIPSSIGQGDEYGTTKVLGSQGNEGVALQVSTGFGFEI